MMTSSDDKMIDEIWWWAICNDLRVWTIAIISDDSLRWLKEMSYDDELRWWALILSYVDLLVSCSMILFLGQLWVQLGQQGLERHAAAPHQYSNSVQTLRGWIMMNKQEHNLYCLLCRQYFKKYSVFSHCSLSGLEVFTNNSDNETSLGLLLQTSAELFFRRRQCFSVKESSRCTDSVYLPQLGLHEQDAINAFRVNFNQIHTLLLTV